MAEDTRKLVRVVIDEEEELSKIAISVCMNDKAIKERKAFILNGYVPNNTKRNCIDGIEERTISDLMYEYYLQYAKETIESRAIADIRDGNKPVQLRIIHSMNNLGLSPGSKTVKCAKVVGDVLGNYHPHGDSSVYSALVNMAQPWNVRYPFITFRGNVGSVDGDSAAASRYTECKLSPIAHAMFTGINKNTVDLVDNYDETQKEPTISPSLIPIYLVNGTAGIACGFASNIPSHNLNEVYDACIFVLDTLLDDDLVVEDLEEYIASELPKYIKGPDLPGGGVIINNSEWPKIVKTGKGKVTVRASYEITENKNKKKQMVITELPYQVNKLNLVEKIEDIIINKTIEGIDDIKDLSSNGDIKIVITFKKGANHSVVINNLLAKTDLKKNLNYNMIALNKKELLDDVNIVTAIDEFLEHGVDIVRREAEYDYNKKLNRLYLVEALLKVLESDETIEKAIRIVRYSKDNKVADLMNEFNLSEEQANYILSRQIGQLSQENFDVYTKEQETLSSEIPELENIKDNKDYAAFIKLKEKFVELKEKFGDERRTVIELEDEITNEDLIKDEDLIVTITSEGNIKSVLSSEYNTQKRNGKGSKGAEMDDFEIITQLFTLKSKDDLFFISNKGRVHHFKAYKLPKVSKSAKGRNIANYVSLEEDEHLVTTIATRINESDDQYIIFITNKGQITKISIKALIPKKGNVIKALKLIEGHELVDAKLMQDTDDVFVATSSGIGSRYSVSSELRAQGKGGTGVMGIKKATNGPEIDVVGITKVQPNTKILTVTEQGLAKATDESEITAKSRRTTGVKWHKLSDKTGKVVSVLSVTDEDSDLLVATKLGKIIRLNLEDVQKSGRNTTGTSLIKLDNGDTVKTVSIAPKNTEDIDEE